MNGFLPPGAHAEYLDLDGGRVRLLRGGEPSQRPPMILLHGGGSNAAISWYRTIAPLSVEHQVIAPDLPGYGGTTGIEPGGGGAVLADFVARVMNQVGLTDAVIVGSSMGGEIALNLALHHPELVRALVLISPAGLMPLAGNRVVQYLAWLSTRLPERILVSLNGLSNRPSKALRGIVHDPAGLPTAVIEEYRREARRREFRLAFVRQTRISVGPTAMRNNLLPLIGRITVPTLFVHGAVDPVVPPESSRQAAERMFAARRVVIPDSGHWAQLEAPDRFFTELTHFLTSTAKDGGPSTQDLQEGHGFPGPPSESVPAWRDEPGVSTTHQQLTRPQSPSLPNRGATVGRPCIDVGTERRAPQGSRSGDARPARGQAGGRYPGARRGPDSDQEDHESA